MISYRIKAVGILALSAFVATSVHAQARDNGAIVGRGFLGQKVMPDEFQLFHTSEFKGAHRVAISVFNVAFPHSNHFTAKTSGHSGRFSSAASATMDTTMVGLDRSTQQRIADHAYAAFVEQLTAAGYEVVDQIEFSKLAPERATWTSQPNFAEGRFGSYVAPTGMSVYFMPGDKAKRDTSGFMGQQFMAMTAATDRPQAFTRSAYLAHDANVGVIAVSLVLDYGVYSSSGERRGLGGASASFLPGVSLAAGNAVDRATTIQYWGTHSGGFPASALLQQPVRSEIPFAAGGTTDFHIVADPSAFERAAADTLAKGLPKLVEVMVEAR